MSYYGEVTIHKDKRTGKWRASMDYYDADHKRRFVTKTLKSKLKRDAKEEAKGWKEELEKAAELLPIATSNKKLTVKQACEQYLDHQLKMNEIEQSTYSTQCSLMRKRVYPYIGNYSFTSIDKVVINKWLTELYEDGCKSGYVNNIYNSVKKVYTYHYMNGDIDRSPFSYVKTPKKKANRVTFLDTNQFDDLIEAINKKYEIGSEFWTAYQIALYSGLRRGEISGLRWGDINFDTGVVSVSNAVSKGDNGTYTKGPKNESSFRTFPMLPQMIDVLLLRKEYVVKHDGEPLNSWYVVGQKDKYMKPAILGTHFGRFVREFELKDHFGAYITLHGLRHNIGFNGVQAHMDIESLANFLGHANVAMTLNTYATTSPDAMITGAEKLGRYITEQSDILDALENE